MQTSGLILDIYDDYNGDVIRSFFPTREEVPDSVKQAQALDASQRDLLPDDAFALVLQNGDSTLRKFACIDEGNTSLSVLYFLANGHRLPIEAQKVAAVNLMTACGWYELDVPEQLEKVALGVDTLVRGVANHPMATFNAVMTGPAVASQAAHEIRDNNAAQNMVRGGHIGGPPISPREMREIMGKQAEASGTLGLMPNQVPGDPRPLPAKAVVPKVASADAAAVPNNLSYHVKGEQPKSNPQAKVLHPHVDVSHCEPPTKHLAKTAHLYALNGRYPLDTYAQVKQASAYFDEYGKHLQPEERREYCLNLVKRAEALGIPLKYNIMKYGGEEFAPEAEIKLAYEMRQRLIIEDGHVQMLNALFEKRAEYGAELFCDTLAEFDKLAGLNYSYDKDLVDPYFSTYGVKVAEEFSEIIGNDMVTACDLERAARVGAKALRSTFGEDFTVEFQKDPVGIFKSLPRDQKKIIMRMATDNSAPGLELHN